MIPIRDTVRSQSFPILNTLLIILNVLIFIYESSLGQRGLEQFIFTYGLVPAQFWAEGPALGWLPMFTSMFLHGSWSHLISNMLALYIFGDNVEDRMGRLRYLLFYLLGGLLAGLTHLLIYPTSPIPTVGASGAIAAVLGAYLVLYPRARVISLLPFFIIFPIVEIPAIFYLGLWFVTQLLNGAMALGAGALEGGGIAFFAHIGGFVAGMVLVWLFASRQPRRPYYPDEYQPW
jgi:membrane associated rhomboid family serine protease